MPRRAETDRRLAQVAETYRAAIINQTHPVTAVERALNVTRTNATTLIWRARKAGHRMTPADTPNLEQR